MSKRGRPKNLSGTVFPRKESAFLWVRHPDRAGRITRESTGTKDPE